jgi:ABC-type multidrug transport system fused ATPase/permease subunit
MNGKMSYAGQQAWILNATVKENITIDEDIDDGKYEEVLKVCELLPDLELLPAGDLTEIGEKGVNLSGGQKQRIGLAQTVYQPNDIYLFDDPLSAVDPHVGAAIFENCICRYLHGKTRIIVTHQLQYLSRADKIIVLDEGRLVESGTYTELMNTGGKFSQLIQKHETKSYNGDSSLPPLELKEERCTKKENGNPANAKIIKDEDRAVGNIDSKIYQYYITAMGIGSFILLVILCLGSTVMPVLSDWWLSTWTSGVQNHTHSSSYYISGFILISIISIVIAFGSSLGIIFAGLNASKRIHLEMLQRVLNAPMTFFDSTPLGRIINRFTSDLDTIDNNLPGTVKTAICGFFSVIASICSIAIVTVFFLVFVMPLGMLKTIYSKLVIIFFSAFMYQQIQRFYLRSSREIKRLQMISKSPIMSHFSETVRGLVSIRAFKKQQSFITRNEEIVDRSAQTNDIAKAISLWFFLCNESLGIIILVAVGFIVVTSRGTIDAGLAGFALICATNIPNYLSDFLLMASNVETELVSVERCQSFTAMPIESNGLFEPDRAWPQQGTISFDHVRLRYRDGLPLALVDVTCQIRSREKIGIVGRTGAGKSSLLTALLRICELESGKIVIDGIDIATIALYDLRSRIAVIPQDPVLFAGKYRRTRIIDLISVLRNCPYKFGSVRPKY